MPAKQTVFQGEAYILGTTWQRELEQLAVDIVYGSWAYHEVHSPGTPIDPTERWPIGPMGACSVWEDGKTRDDEGMTLSEFIGGIAVVNGIEPEPIEIDTVIYFIGRHMTLLELQKENIVAKPVEKEAR